MSKTDIKIRKGTFEDLPSVYLLVKELALYEKEPHAVTASIEDYESMYKEGEIAITVATFNDEVIGMALYYLTFSTWKGRMLYLEDFYVKPEHRSHGVGQLLFDAFISEAKTRKCSMVKWQVLDWNEDAIRFYHRNGATIEKEWYNGKIIF